MSEEVEVMDKELPPPEIQNLIQHAMDQEFTRANDIFQDVMTIKLSDLLDQEQIRLADQIYNGADPDEEDDDDFEDDQLELDLEAEDELESDDEEDSEDDEAEDEDDEI
jgi:hypothetical protein